MLSSKIDSAKPKREKDLGVSDKENITYPPLNLPFRHSVVDGWIYPPFINEKTIETSKQFKLRPEDVFIATFPKCGTTWTQKIVQKLHEVHCTCALEGLGTHLLEIIPWLENSKVEEIDARASPRYLKTHSPYNHVAYDKSVPCKYIYVSRNPKDACVSLYHHARGFAVFGYSGEFADFAELFLQGKVESGCWWTHLKEFYVNSRKMDTLFLRYEDMHSEGEKMIQQINDYIGMPKLSGEMCARVKDETSFKKMKKDPSANYSWKKDSRKQEESPFMRKGTVGDWANFFTKDLSDRFDAKTQKMLGEFEVFQDYTHPDQ